MIKDTLFYEVEVELEFSLMVLHIIFLLFEWMTENLIKMTFNRIS